MRRILPDRPLTSTERSKRYMAKHPEQKALRAKRQRSYRKRNPEKIRAANKKWSESNLKYKSNYMNVYYRRSIVKCMVTRAKQRAKKKGVTFSITEKDIVLPDKCPVLGILLEVGNGQVHDASPSLDRIRPDEGYIPGNVVIVSHRANTIKSNATIKELRTVADFYEKLGL